MQTKPFTKIIAGIENRDVDKVLLVLSSAAFCGVEAVDLCDDQEIIKLAKQRLHGSRTKLFVSSLEARKLIQAAKLGADFLELGNYDHLYPQGLKVEPKEIIASAQDVLDSGLDNLCVTIPGYLGHNEQADLAKALYEMGVQMLQTEGGSVLEAKFAGSIGHIEKAKHTLANTLELRRACPEAKILAAGGLSNITAPMAVIAGANGIGIGKMVNKLTSEIEMIASIKLVQESLKAIRETVGSF
ncbi:MAG: DUF561 domain-containing protein [Candidatus Caenarcaniphilales bacterium]|nr:DUF561 domain-containing protein [Candidatus Caenarcaniphilales bacterium]